MYTETITITEDMIAKLEAGSIKIRAGQWIKFPWLTKKSRFVGVTKAGSIWAIHKNYGKFQAQIDRIKEIK